MNAITELKKLYDETAALFGIKRRAPYYVFSKKPKTVEQVDRDTAIYDGKRIKLERTDKLVAGQYYIRFFVGCTGNAYPEVLKMVGRQYANRQYHYGMCIKMQSRHNDEPRRAFLFDLGFTNRKSKESSCALYRFTPSAYAFLEDISKRNMMPEMLKLMHGFDVPIDDKIAEQELQRESDRYLESLYGY